MMDARRTAPFASTGREFPLRTSSSLDDQSALDPMKSPAAESTIHRLVPRNEARLRRVAADIVRSVESRLPGRVRDLKVRVEDDQFILSGVSSSYYVKQVAQHVAMTALDAVMLGRLVNEIEVRTLR